jgi:septal ring factor EnvC (AmiA/AmiB activator)
MQAIKAAGEKIKQAYIKANADAKNKFKEILFDVDKKLAGSRAHIKSMIEAKEKRIDEMNEQLSTLDNEIKKAQKDHNEAQERRAEFEKTKMNEKGEIISDFEEPC